MISNSQSILLETSKQFLSKGSHRDAFRVLDLQPVNSPEIYYQRILIQIDSLLANLKEGVSLLSNLKGPIDEIVGQLGRGLTEFGLPAIDTLVNLFSYSLPSLILFGTTTGNNFCFSTNNR